MPQEGHKHVTEGSEGKKVTIAATIYLLTCTTTMQVKYEPQFKNENMDVKIHYIKVGGTKDSRLGMSSKNQRRGIQGVRENFKEGMGAQTHSMWMDGKQACMRHGLHGARG